MWQHFRPDRFSSLQPMTAWHPRVARLSPTPQIQITTLLIMSQSPCSGHVTWKQALLHNTFASSSIPCNCKLARLKQKPVLATSALKLFGVAQAEPVLLSQVGGLHDSLSRATEDSTFQPGKITVANLRKDPATSQHAFYMCCLKEFSMCRLVRGHFLRSKFSSPLWLLIGPLGWEGMPLQSHSMPQASA